jgi:hypothetical protein
MSNADSTSKYSSQLNNLADRLHQDMDVLKTVQSNFGGTLQKELEALAKRGREVSLISHYYVSALVDIIVTIRLLSWTRSSLMRNSRVSPPVSTHIKRSPRLSRWLIKR